MYSLKVTVQIGIEISNIKGPLKCLKIFNIGLLYNKYSYAISIWSFLYTYVTFVLTLYLLLAGPSLEH